MFLQMRPCLLAFPFIIGVSAGFWPFHTKVDALKSDATSNVKQIAIIGTWIYLIEPVSCYNLSIHSFLSIQMESVAKMPIRGLTRSCGGV